MEGTVVIQDLLICYEVGPDVTVSSKAEAFSADIKKRPKWEEGN